MCTLQTEQPDKTSYTRLNRIVPSPGSNTARVSQRPNLKTPSTRYKISDLSPHKDKNKVLLRRLNVLKVAAAKGGQKALVSEARSYSPLSRGPLSFYLQRFPLLSPHHHQPRRVNSWKLATARPAKEMAADLAPRKVPTEEGPRTRSYAIVLVGRGGASCFPSKLDRLLVVEGRNINTPRVA